MTTIETIAEAFSTGNSSYQEMCNCGKVFYDSSGNHWDWEEGELASLSKDPDSVALDYAVGTIFLNNTYYVADCTCWHKLGKMVFEFLMCHRKQVAKMFQVLRANTEAYLNSLPKIT
jgi:hypothetical protein